MDPTILHGIPRIRVLLPISIHWHSVVSVSMNRRGWMAAGVPRPFEKNLPWVGQPVCCVCAWVGLFLDQDSFSRVWTHGYLDNLVSPGCCHESPLVGLSFSSLASAVPRASLPTKVEPAHAPAGLASNHVLSWVGCATDQRWRRHGRKGGKRQPN